MPNPSYFAALAAILLTCCAPRLFAAASTQPAPLAEADAIKTDTVFISPLRPWQLGDDDDDQKSPATTGAAGGRYFFGLLDSRSSYGKDFFHDPFLGPEFDAERQVEIGYQHGENHGLQDDEIDAEVQWTLVGQFSVAAEFGWDSQHQAGPGGDGDRQSATGFENVDLAVYHPVYQFVSDDRFFDYTAALRLDVGIPTRTAASGDDALLTPYLGQLLRLGDHVSVEGWTGWQFTIAPHQPTDLIYGLSLGYAIPHSQLPLPAIDQFTPIFELDGQSPCSGPGQDVLFGVGGFETSFRSIGNIQPQFQIGYQFPIDQGARDQLRWGIITQIFVQF